jgi:hypothetical protein
MNNEKAGHDCTETERKTSALLTRFYYHAFITTSLYGLFLFQTFFNITGLSRSAKILHCSLIILVANLHVSSSFN